MSNAGQQYHLISMTYTTVGTTAPCNLNPIFRVQFPEWDAVATRDLPWPKLSQEI